MGQCGEKASLTPHVIVALVKSAAGPYVFNFRIGLLGSAAPYASAAAYVFEDVIKFRTWPWPKVTGRETVIAIETFRTVRNIVKVVLIALAYICLKSHIYRVVIQSRQNLALRGFRSGPGSYRRSSCWDSALYLMATIESLETPWDVGRTYHTVDEVTP